MAFGYKIYFTERAHNRVVCWDPDKDKMEVVAGEEKVIDRSQRLTDPYGLAVDAQGNLLIADKLNNRICRLKGKSLQRLATKDTSGHRKSRFIDRIDSPECPTGLFVEPNGTLLCAFSEDHTIYRIHPDGQLELVLGIPVVNSPVFRGCRETVPAGEVVDTPINMPTSVVSRPDGTIYFIERGYQVVREYHPQRGIRSLFPASQRENWVGAEEIPASVSMDAYHPTFPTDLALEKSGTLFLSDCVHRCVWEVDSKANRLSQVMKTPDESEGGGGPSAISCTMDGNLWVLDTASAKVMGFKKDSDGKWKALSVECSIAPQKAGCSAHQGAGIAVV